MANVTGAPMLDETGQGIVSSLQGIANEISSSKTKLYTADLEVRLKGLTWTQSEDGKYYSNAIAVPVVHSAKILTVCPTNFGDIRATDYVTPIIEDASHIRLISNVNSFAKTSSRYNYRVLYEIELGVIDTVDLEIVLPNLTWQASDSGKYFTPTAMDIGVPGVSKILSVSLTNFANLRATDEVEPYIANSNQLKFESNVNTFAKNTSKVSVRVLYTT